MQPSGPEGKTTKDEELEAPKIDSGIWDILKERKRRGLWSGNIEHIEIKEHKINAGPHFYVIEDARKRSIVCTSCPIKHGGVLEASMLTRYTVENGVLYLDGVATNVVP